MDANTEAPEARRFNFDPRELIRGRLQAYRADLLAILLSYQAAGAPAIGGGGFGSFNEWERLVRQCICWLVHKGLTPAPMADPLEVLQLSKAEDPHHVQHIAVLEAWHARYGSRPVQVKELANLMHKSEAYRSMEEHALCEALADVGIPTRGRGEFETRYFSGWLRRHRGRVVAGLRLDRAEVSKKHGHSWLVRTV
jgi:putative DNA primase/helicase